MVEEYRTSQRIEISPSMLKFGLGRIGKMFEREVAEASGFDIKDPERRSSEAKALAFGQVMAAMIVALDESEYIEGKLPGTSVAASAAVEKMVGWYEESAREARTTFIAGLDIGEEIALYRAVAFGKSLSAIGLEGVVGQINAQLISEGGPVGR